jgi:hypothetical protein
MFGFPRKGWSIDSEGGAWAAERKGGEPAKKNSDGKTWLSLVLRNLGWSANPNDKK